MRTWFSRHPVWFMAFYMVFYLTVFHWLEVHITVPDIWVHCRLDDFIPFCKYAIVPYLAWFVWIPFTLFYLLRKAPRADFWRLCLPLFAGMTFALACYIVLPTGLYLRPYRVYGNDIFAQAVRLLYATDTPTSVCPSIHVFNSVTLMLAYYRSRIFDAPQRPLDAPGGGRALRVHRAGHRAAQTAQLHRRDDGHSAGPCPRLGHDPPGQRPQPRAGAPVIFLRCLIDPKTPAPAREQAFFVRINFPAGRYLLWAHSPS